MRSVPKPALTSTSPLEKNQWMPALAARRTPVNRTTVHAIRRIQPLHANSDDSTKRSREFDRNSATIAIFARPSAGRQRWPKVRFRPNSLPICSGTGATTQRPINRKNVDRVRNVTCLANGECRRLQNGHVIGANHRNPAASQMLDVMLGNRVSVSDHGIKWESNTGAEAPTPPGNLRWPG